MDHYVTGNTIKQLREKRNLTQTQLADKIGVSSKTISKWETARGLPDITLLEPEEPEKDHTFTLEPVENEVFLTIHHPMTKNHYISFAAHVTSDRIQLVKFYPESDAQTRLQLRGLGYLVYYCNRHGLYKKKL